MTAASNLEGCVQISLGALRAKGQPGKRKWHGLKEEPENVWEGWGVGRAQTSLSIEPVMPSNHLILCQPLLLPLSIFPSIGSFAMSQFFTSGGQSIGVSPMTVSLKKSPLCLASNVWVQILTHYLTTHVLLLLLLSSFSRVFYRL